MANQTITIEDIARRLNVSKATVSYVLSGKARRVGVSEEMTRRVREAAKELKYVPNHWAKALSSQRTGMISVIFDTLLMGWSQRVMDGIEEVLIDANYTAAIYAHTIASSRNNHLLKSEERKVLSILERRDEGVICQIVDQFKPQYKKLITAGVPMVFLNEIEDMAGLETVDRVGWDSGQAAEVAVKHLIDCGYKRIGYFGLQLAVKSCHERYAAYLSVMQQAGLAVNPQWIINQKPISPLPPYTDLATQFKEMILGDSPKPDAIFVMNDYLAIHLLGIMRECGLKTPDDIALVGMGELDVTSVAGLTTMREPLYEIGRQAAKILLNRIQNPSAEPVFEHITCNELIIRNSTAGKAKPQTNSVESMPKG